MNTKALLSSVVIATGLFFTTSLSAQTKVDFPSPSPLGSLKQRVGLTDIEITYSRPSAKGRPIFGGLVPYGQIWRTGANAATKISFSTPVTLNNTAIPAGEYSIFTIPDKEKWTIIVNNDLGLWGSYNYNSKRDELRFDIPVQSIQGDMYEQFTMQFDQRNELADLQLLWDRVKISIPVKFIN